jgi:hypothetical protein
MSLKDEVGRDETADLDEALKDFRQSVHAWSEAAYSRPRSVAAATAVRRPIWRLASGLALGCAVIAGGVTVYQHHRQPAAIAVVQVATRAQPAIQQRIQPVRQEDEDLLAKVDSDVSREVPLAMEPLAQLMVEDETP